MMGGRNPCLLRYDLASKRTKQQELHTLSSQRTTPNTAQAQLDCLLANHGDYGRHVEQMHSEPQLPAHA